MSLAPIDASKHFERSINGGLLNLCYSPMQKWKITITGDDQDPPALDGVWPGTPLTIGCIVELATQNTPSHSANGTDREQDSIWTFTKPTVDVLLMDFQVQRDEYGCQTSWSMDVEEV